jgi:hypothetical protein
MFHRGDLVLDRDDRSNVDVVYFLIHESRGYYWWVRNFGPLRYSGWNKYLAEEHSFNSNCLKLSINDLSKEKQKIYQEFKTEYLDTDLV